MNKYNIHLPKLTKPIRVIQWCWKWFLLPIFILPMSHRSKIAPGRTFIVPFLIYVNPLWMCRRQSKRMPFMFLCAVKMQTLISFENFINCNKCKMLLSFKIYKWKSCKPFNVQLRNVLDQTPFCVALHVAAFGHQPNDGGHGHLTVDLK